MGKNRNGHQVRSYKSFVAERTQQNHHLENLREFLQKDAISQHACHIASLDFHSGNSPPSRRSLNVESLKSLLSDKLEGGDLRGRLLIVEDLSSDVVETLGSLLDIDPLFFASHMDTAEIDIKKTRLQTAILPSTKRSQKFLNLQYHRVIEFENLKSDQTMFRNMNVSRKVKILSQLKGITIGLARHCCSILRTERIDGLWLGLILIDAPISNSYNSNAGTLTLQTRSFQGGFLDFLSGPSFSDDTDPEFGPIRSSPLETVVFYLVTQQAQGFDKSCPTLLSLSYYPLRIIAAEWMVYQELMYYSIKQYEYSLDTTVASLGNIATLIADIHALQQWARRSIATAHKIRYVIDFLDYCMNNDKDVEYSAPIREDYEQIAFSIETYSRRLEAMVSIATSLIQATDSRRSLTETVNLSRLSYLTLSFIPLTFVSGIFSMNDNIAPGGKLFVLYFAVSIPLCILVFLIVQPRTSTSGIFAWVGKPRAMYKSVV